VHESLLRPVVQVRSIRRRASSAATIRAREASSLASRRSPRGGDVRIGELSDLRLFPPGTAPALRGGGDHAPEPSTTIGPPTDERFRAPEPFRDRSKASAKLSTGPDCRSPTCARCSPPRGDPVRDGQLDLPCSRRRRRSPYRPPRVSMRARSAPESRPTSRVTVSRSWRATPSARPGWRPAAAPPAPPEAGSARRGSFRATAPWR
jgi:hypothetical protein